MRTCTVVLQHAQSGSVARDFVMPLLKAAERTQHQRLRHTRSPLARGRGARHHQCNGLQRFPQSHLVAQNAAQQLRRPRARVALLHPSQPLQLTARVRRQNKKKRAHRRRPGRGRAAWPCAAAAPAACCPGASARRRELCAVSNKSANSVTTHRAGPDAPLPARSQRLPAAPCRRHTGRGRAGAGRGLARVSNKSANSATAAHLELLVRLFRGERPVRQVDDDCALRRRVAVATR